MASLDQDFYVDLRHSTKFDLVPHQYRSIAINDFEWMKPVSLGEGVDIPRYL